ncbi:MAG: PhnD/SsuA/transferrin family substrate-binding protein [Bryobacteraceae bacterium]|jgi:phosphonate transport system substrate-binding protein
MARDNGTPAPVSATHGTTTSRRHALALMLGAGRWLPGALAATDAGAPVRLAISESVVGDVNLYDARAAMQIWIKKMTQDLNLVLDVKLFATTQEIVEGTLRGRFDCVALNVIEYRQVTDKLDSSRIVNAAGSAGLEQYVILVKQNSGIRQLGDLKGRRLCTLKTPKMCVAPTWLFTVLEDGHYGPAEHFFGSVATDTKFSRVVLPVFFGQADACLTSKRGFDTMCELNPQVARDLKVLISSPAMVVDFYIFRKNYQSMAREKVISALSSLRSSAAGQQLATLFHFDELTVRDASCLTSALSVLERAERATAGHKPGAERDRE